MTSRVYCGERVKHTRRVNASGLKGAARCGPQQLQRVRKQHVLRRRHDTRAAAGEPRSWPPNLTGASSRKIKHILRCAVSRATTSLLGRTDDDAAHGRQVFLPFVFLPLGPALYIIRDTLLCKYRGCVRSETQAAEAGSHEALSRPANACTCKATAHAREYRYVLHHFK